MGRALDPGWYRPWTLVPRPDPLSSVCSCPLWMQPWRQLAGPLGRHPGTGSWWLPSSLGGACVNFFRIRKIQKAWGLSYAKAASRNLKLFRLCLSKLSEAPGRFLQGAPDGDLWQFSHWRVMVGWGHCQMLVNRSFPRPLMYRRVWKAEGKGVLLSFLGQFEWAPFNPKKV